MIGVMTSKNKSDFMTASDNTQKKQLKFFPFNVSSAFTGNLSNILNKMYFFCKIRANGKSKLLVYLFT